MFRGSMVALVTPMREDGSLDEAGLRHLVDFHVAKGTQALVVVGTTGESATLDEDEHCQVIRWVVQQTAGRVPVIAGAGANCTTEAIRLTACARQAGADACLSVVPYYNKPTQEGLYRHFRAIASAVAIPQILYNVPGRTVCDMTPETTARLAQIDNIIGIKDATGDLTRLPRLRAGCGPDFGLYSGDDATGCEFMLRGGDGVISVTANLAPRQMANLCQAALQGDRADAEALDAPLRGLHKALFVESNPIPVKWAAAELGLLASPGIRLPLTWLSEDVQANVRTALQQAGLL
ncbi:MAG: 4-hydroxy-tetrahydrodipicolinate synthase [Pseudomonadota bacterium]